MLMCVPGLYALHVAATAPHSIRPYRSIRIVFCTGNIGEHQGVTTQSLVIEDKTLTIFGLDSIESCSVAPALALKQASKLTHAS